MAARYQQFLGSHPGVVVELLDDSSSPYLVRTDQKFEFYISAEDFRNYYREESTETPARWSHFVTEPETGMVDANKMATVMEIVHSVESAFQDFDKARRFVRNAAKLLQADPALKLEQVRRGLEEAGWSTKDVSDAALQLVLNSESDIRRLLLSDTCAVGEFAELPEEGGDGKEPKKATAKRKATSATGEPAKESVKGFRSRMKNVEMSIEGDMLSIKVDLSKEFGPSKSGKTTIVASTEGNKSVPGRDEKVGLNIYKKEDKRPAKGRRKSFKNVEMDVQKDILTLAVDLSKEFGPSKSGKTIIIASTEGNQLVFERDEKIGLNVYRKIE
jgi:hypothetical protein